MATGTQTQTQTNGLSGFQWAVLATTAIQAVSGIYSSYRQSQHVNAMAKIQERIAAINEKRAINQANAALAASNANIANITGQYGQLKSKQRVATAANGIAIGYGSSRDIQATTELYKQVDVNTAYANGLYAALGYMSKATAARQSGMATTTSNTGAVAFDSLLTGIEKVAGYYYDASTKGLGNAESGTSGVDKIGQQAPEAKIRTYEI